MDHRLLKFLSFNVRSLIDQSRQIELTDTLIKNKIDIAFIQECHLKRNKKVKIPGYNFIYDYSPIGVAILIKNTIKYNRIASEDIDINAIFIQIESTSNDIVKKYLLGSLYVPCNFPSSQLYDSLNKCLQMAANFDGFLYGGDFNSKNIAWGDSFDNCNGKTFFSWLMDNSTETVRICDMTPSFPNGSSFLDHFIGSPTLLNIYSLNYNISSLPTFSDHFPLMLQLCFDTTNLILRIPQFITSYKSTDWKRQDMDYFLFIYLLLN